MTVLLVLVTFGTFLMIDYIRTRKAVKRLELEASPVATDPSPRPRRALVRGFDVPDNLRYHPGHTWALSESPNLVRVGMDDFAGRLVGKAENIKLPMRGQWIRQGQKMCTIRRDGCTTDMVSPIEGTVSDVNDEVLTHPELPVRDPYGDGWLITVQAPDAKTCFRNLLGGALARRWMDEAAMRLQLRMPTALGVLAQDGGVAVNDVSAALPDEKWLPLTKEFFLT